MTNLFRKLLLCSVFFLSPLAHSLTLNANLTGEQLVWKNGIRVNDYLTSSNWQVLGGLPPTKEWTPGTFIAKPQEEIVLSNGTDKVTIPIDVSGMQFGLGAAANKFPERVDTSSSACSQFQLRDATAAVVGSGCSAGVAYKGAEYYTPFQFSRPLVKFSDSEVVKAFGNSGVPEGVYSGHITVSPFYMYRSQGGAWTYRQFGPTPLSVRVRYIPSFLTNIQVLGNGLMTPAYDTKNHKVSGLTGFKVKANGLFTSGVKLTFDDRPKGGYKLQHSEINSSIAYDVRCQACTKQQIIQDGTLQLPNAETIVQGSGSLIAFDLLVEFESDVSDVESGLYTDNLVVYFEANL